MLTLDHPRAAAAVATGGQFGLGGKPADQEVARVARRQKRAEGDVAPARGQDGLRSRWGRCRSIGRGDDGRDQERRSLGGAIGGDLDRRRRIANRRSLPNDRGGVGRWPLVGRPRRRPACDQHEASQRQRHRRGDRAGDQQARLALAPMELV